MGKKHGDSNPRLSGEAPPAKALAQVTSRQWRAIIDAIAHPIWLLDAEMRIVAGNEATSSFFGVSPSEIRGRHCWEVVHGGDAPIPECPAERAAKSGRRESLRMQLDGRWIEVTVDPFADEAGGHAGCVHLVDDVTERVRLEAELRASERRYRSLAEQNNDILYSMTPEGILVYASPQTEAVLGYRPEEVLGRGFADLVHPDDLPAVRANFARVLAGDALRNQFRVRTKSGSDRWVQSSSRVVRDDDGLVTVNGVLTDIHQRRELDARLAQADRLSGMGLLAGGLAHEISNPLAYLLQSLDSLAADLREMKESGAALREALARELGAESARAIAEPASNGVTAENHAEKMLADARAGARRIEETTDNLRRFSGAGRDRQADLDLDHALDLALGLADNEIRHRARVVRQRGATRTVCAEEARLSHVFLNVLVNAAQAIEPGHVDENEIRVRTWSEDEWTCAEVSDTGCGIGADAQQRIFEPFFTTREIGEASGLGLAIAKSVVEELGGTIEVASKPGTGARFTIRLPAAPRAPAVPTLPAAKTPAPARPGRILIVDDEPKIRAGIRRLLRSHTTVEAGSGRQARALVEADPGFDAILCDVMMPDGSGTELYAWLLEEHPELADRFVFVTGGAFTRGVRDALDRAEAPVLTKPFAPQALLSLVAEILAKRPK